MTETGTTYRLTPRPRKLRLRWLVAYFSIIFLGVPVTHGIVYWCIARGLDRRIDALHDAGERVEPADFDGNSLPEDNAAKDIAAAAAIVDANTVGARSIDALPTTRPIPTRAWPYLDSAVDSFEPALDKVELAMTRSHCQWNHSFQTPVLKKLLLPELAQCRSVGGLLNAASLVEHRQHRDDLVIRRMQEMLFLSSACERSPMIGDFCACGFVGMAAGRIEELAPFLSIGDMGNGAARPSDCRKLIAMLLDESTASEGLKYQLITQRMEVLDDYRSLFDGDSFRAVSAYIDGPKIDHDAEASLDEMTEAIHASLATSDWPEIDQKLAGISEPRWWLIDLGGLQSVRFEIRAHFMAIADRRLAATALAIRLYFVDHHGEFPDTLDNLVPGYLSSVPIDPMAAGGKRLSYLPRSQNPILYSVGLNGTDDHGDESANPGDYGEINEWHRLDRVFYLSPHLRAYLFVPRPNSNGQIFTPWEPEPAPWDQDRPNSTN